MTEAEKTILELLYNDSNSPNLTDDFLSKKADIDLIEFNKTIIILERKRYIEECTNPNQRTLLFDLGKLLQKEQSVLMILKMVKGF